MHLVDYMNIFGWIGGIYFVSIIPTCKSCCWPEWSWSRSCIIWGIEAWKKYLIITIWESKVWRKTSFSVTGQKPANQDWESYCWQCFLLSNIKKCFYYLQIRVESHVAGSAVPPAVTAVVAVSTLATWKPANSFVSFFLTFTFCLWKSVTHC